MSEEYIQVGRQCLSDFLGKNADNYAAAAELYSLVGELGSASEEDEEGGWSGGGGQRYEYLDQFLAYVAECIRHVGWMSKSRARFEDKTSTSELAMFHMHPPHDREARKALLFHTPTSESVEEGKQAIGWALSLTDEEVDPSDYLHNLRVIARRGIINYKQLGFAASMVAAYQKAMLKLKLAEGRKASEWVGTVGERSIFELTVEKVIGIEGAWGVSKLHIMSDRDGNTFKWFCSGWPFQVGKDYFVKGTVKAHKEWKGVRETLLSRCDDVVYEPYICTLKGVVYEVEAIDEKDARKRALKAAGLERLPKGSTIILKPKTEAPTSTQENA